MLHSSVDPFSNARQMSATKTCSGIWISFARKGGIGGASLRKACPLLSLRCSPPRVQNTVDFLCDTLSWCRLQARASCKTKTCQKRPATSKAKQLTHSHRRSQRWMHHLFCISRYSSHSIHLSLVTTLPSPVIKSKNI